MDLEARISTLFARGADADRAEARAAFAELREELSAGRVRAAEPDAAAPTGWRVNAWVKQGILVGFRYGDIVPFPSPDAASPWLDKDTLPLRPLSAASRVRLVPGGSSVRDGAYLGVGVICMPPMYINIGAYVGDGSLIDSHALVGSCAQVGSGVHVSAGAQIGGVLEPVGALPVIVEDDALVGGNTGLYEGAVVKAACRDRRRHGADRFDTDLRFAEPSGDQAGGWRADGGAGGCGGRAGRTRRHHGSRTGVGTVARDTGHREVPRRETDTRTALEDWLR